jgi:hypothetical protein
MNQTTPCNTTSRDVSPSLLGACAEPKSQRTVETAEMGTGCRTAKHVSTLLRFNRALTIDEPANIVTLPMARSPWVNGLCQSIRDASACPASRDMAMGAWSAISEKCSYGRLCHLSANLEPPSLIPSMASSNLCNHSPIRPGACISLTQ